MRSDVAHASCAGLTVDERAEILAHIADGGFADVAAICRLANETANRDSPDQTRDS